MFKDIITRALGLNPGERIEIMCLDFDDMERKRQRLYREKARVKELSEDIAESILISRDKKNFKLTIYRVSDDLGEVRVITNDGVETMGG